MLYKNTKPLEKKKTIATGDAMDMAALRVLAGMCCSECDKPLSSVDHKGQWGYVHKHSAYTCCGQAHCPYCGASGKEKCAHLVAYRTSGNWRIFGLPDVADMLFPQAEPLSPTAIMGHTTEQKQKAFGAAFPLLEKLYSPRWYGQTYENISAELIVNHLIKPNNKQEIPTTANLYYFSEATDGIAERLQQALCEDLPEAFPRLKAMPIANAEYLVKAFELPINEEDKQSSRASFIDFSSCGKYLIVLNALTGQVWDMTETEPKLLASFSALERRSNPHHAYQCARFSKTGDQIELFRANPNDRYGWENGEWETRSVHTGAFLDTELLSKSSKTSWQDLLASRNQTTDLHGGRLCLTTRTATIRIYRRNEKGRKAGKPLLIPLRHTIKHMAVSPDQETFATTSDRFVCIWRIPHLESKRS